MDWAEIEYEESLAGPELRSAMLSRCGTYRFVLTRDWSRDWEADSYKMMTGEPRGEPSITKVVWVMLNPSKADGSTDDPTIRKCRGFSERWGFTLMSVVNLYAYRATDPRDLRKAVQEGRHETWATNREHVESEITDPDTKLVIAAWGGGAPNQRNHTRLREMTNLLRKYRGKVACLGYTKKNQPRHPLMLGYDTPLVAWSPDGPGGIRGATAPW